MYADVLRCEPWRTESMAPVYQPSDLQAWAHKLRRFTPSFNVLEMHLSKGQPRSHSQTPITLASHTHYHPAAQPPFIMQRFFAVFVALALLAVTTGASPIGAFRFMPSDLHGGLPISCSQARGAKH
jgi:hypothetical protein